MPTNDKHPRPEKKKGLTDKELIEKYECGDAGVGDIIKAMLDNPAPNVPVKKDKEKKPKD